MSVKKERKHINLVGGSSAAATKKRIGKFGSRGTGAKFSKSTKASTRSKARGTR